jgi:hypothetical protein
LFKKVERKKTRRQKNQELSKIIKLRPAFIFALFSRQAQKYKASSKIALLMIV